MSDDDFAEFERMMDDAEFIDVANPHVKDAMRYAHEQRLRMRAEGHPDYRQTARVPDFPYPAQDNPMLAYLLAQAQTLNEDKSLETAITWLAAHAWYEGALNALDGRSPRTQAKTSPDLRLLRTYYGGLDESIEMIRSADNLDLGVRVHNRWLVEERDEEGEPKHLVGEWVVDLFEEAATFDRDEDDD